MASRFPGGFGWPFPPSSFHHAAFQGNPMHPFPQQELTITEALQVSTLDWNNIRQRLGDISSGLTKLPGKLLGKSTEKPTLEKIVSSWTDERICVLSEQEIQVLAMFLRVLDRLEKVKNAFPVGILLKERSDVNAILSRTAVHSIIHEDISDALEKGTTISSRFRATLSVIPRVLDILCPLAGIPTERVSRNKESKTKTDEERSQSSSQRPRERQPDAARRSSWEGWSKEMHPKTTQQPGSANAQEETRPSDGFNMGDGLPFADELLNGNPDFEFHLMMSVDEWLNMQRRERFQLVYEKKCEETNKLKKEKALLLQQIQEKDKEIEDLKKQKGSKSDGPKSGAEDEKKTVPEMQREDQMENILKRLEQLEAVCYKIKP